MGTTTSLFIRNTYSDIYFIFSEIFMSTRVPIDDSSSLFYFELSSFAPYDKQRNYSRNHR